MESLAFGDLPEGALLLIDSAPIIYVLEDHPKLASRFRPLFEAHAAGRLRFAIATITIAEVLTGPMKTGDEALARRYRAILESWRPVDLNVDIERASARLGVVRHGGGAQPASTMICGNFTVSRPLCGAVLELLPPVLLLKPTTDGGWLEAILQRMVSESALKRPRCREPRALRAWSSRQP